MRAFVFGAVVLAASAAWANDVVKQCRNVVVSPADGATNVPLDVTPELLDDEECGVTFVDDVGRSVTFDFTGDSEGRLHLTPAKPLEPGRTYTIELGRPPPVACDDPRRLITFHTAPAPAVSAIRWQTGGTDVELLEVVLSEPVADQAELLPSAGFVTVERTDGITAVAQDSSEWNSATVAGRYYKVSGTPMPVTASYRVHVKKELRFASGASLAGDFDQVVVPADFPWGWRPGATKADCPAPTDGGCACSTAGGGLVMLLSLAARRTKRR